MRNKERERDREGACEREKEDGGERKIISILIFFMPPSLRSRGPAV